MGLVDLADVGVHQVEVIRCALARQVTAVRTCGQQGPSRGKGSGGAVGSRRRGAAGHGMRCERMVRGSRALENYK